MQGGSAHSKGRSSSSGSSGSSGSSSSGSGSSSRRCAGLRSRIQGLGLNHFILDSRSGPRGLDRDRRLQPGEEEEGEEEEAHREEKE